jgi:hypothetical protein
MTERSYTSGGVDAHTAGAYPMIAFTTLISVCSIIFVGGSSTRGPRGTYSVPEAGGFQLVTHKANNST